MRIKRLNEYIELDDWEWEDDENLSVDIIVMRDVYHLIYRKFKDTKNASSLLLRILKYLVYREEIEKGELDTFLKEIELEKPKSGGDVKKLRDPLDVGYYDEWEDVDASPENVILRDIYNLISIKHHGPKTILRRFLDAVDYMKGYKILSNSDINSFLSEIGEKRPPQPRPSSC